MTMDTAGKAVLFSGVTVLISLTAVMLVPSPAFRSMSLGIMLAVIFVLAATLTLLPAVLGQARPEGRQARAAVGALRRAPLARFAAWGERLWRHPLRYGIPALVVLLALAIPVTQLKTSMPSIKVVPTRRLLAHRLQPGPGRDGPRRHRAAADRRARGRRREGRRAIAQADPGIAAGDADPARSNGLCARHGDPAPGPVEPRGRRRRSTAPRRAAGRRVLGGAVAENHDLQNLLSAKTPLVIGVVLVLGFLLLLFALQAPLLAAAGVLTNLLATGGRVRRRQVDLPGRRPALAARLPAPGVPRRVGAGVLLRDDLRDLDGLHHVPALLRQGALGPHATTPRTRWSAGSRTPAA